MVAEGDNHMLEAILSVLEPLGAQNRAILREIAQDLKGVDGEHWAVGEMLERACIFLIVLDALDITGRLDALDITDHG